MEDDEAYLGIDASKGYADFILLDQSKSVLEEPFNLDDTSEGHKTLKQLIKQWFDAFSLTAIYCGIESTGGYENNWYDLLGKLSGDYSIEVARINPFGIKAHGDAEQRRTTTDEVSAHMIAGYMINYPEKVNYRSDAVDEISSLRSQYSFVRMLKKQVNQSENQLEKLIYSSAPELLRWCRSGIPKWMVNLLSEHPSAKDISEAGINELSQIKGLSESKASQIIAACRNTVASRQDDTIGAVVQSQARKIQTDRTTLIKQKELFIRNGRQTRSEVMELLCSIPGVAEYSATCLIVEIEDVSRFPSASKLVSYSGTHPVYKQSGDGSYGHHMSKKGRTALREVLFNIARTAAIHDEHIKSIYEKHRSRGKGYYSAMGAIMSKMLRIIYGVWSNGTPYDAAIDKHNIEASKPQNNSSTDQKSDRTRRYQKTTTKAPISRRNYKKRKALAEPQSALGTEYEVNDKRS